MQGSRPLAPLTPPLRRHASKRYAAVRIALIAAAAACSGGSPSHGTPADVPGATTPDDGTGLGPGDMSGGAGSRGEGQPEPVGLDGQAPEPPAGQPWSEPLPPSSQLRKIKSVLTGLGPSDAELGAITADPSALGGLIDGWMQTPEFEDRMLLFFQNAFQQSSLAVLDFEFQLRKRPGAFDLPYDTFGDDAYPRLFQNLKESFARTALGLIAEGGSLRDVLTTRRFMLTTALASLYMQIEMPYDIRTQNYRFNQGARPPIEETLDPNSPNYLVFGYAAPTKTTTSRGFNNTCAGDATKISTFPGNTYVFQFLLGAVARDAGTNSGGTSLLGCMEHAAQPYFTNSDLTDWRMVTITDQGTPLRAFDLPALRAATSLPSKLPRVGFFTTPAFLAVWNTNDSNQHRVTANQALLVALGQGYTSAAAAIPVPPNLGAVDGQHAVGDSVCYGCHKSLDPMRQFWGKFYDFNDKPDGRKDNAPSAFGFGDISAEGETLLDFGTFLSQVSDTRVKEAPVNRFALAMTQKLCFFANSSRCLESDPEMRRIALDFESANFDFHVLVRELFSSALVTSAESTETASSDGVTISVARRDQLCGALSTRLGRADLCEIAVPTPTDVTSALNRLAGALPADGFSRGTEFPVTAPDPNLFYQAASELVCEAIAAKVVDAGASPIFASSDVPSALEALVTTVMGVPASDPNHAPAVAALNAHHTAALATAGIDATAALRSTFSAACQAPTTLSMGI
jgi:hypothetical protein